MSDLKSKKILRIGTRGTNLAVKQAEILANSIVTKKICSANDIEIIKIKSSGDLVGSSIGPYDGKGLFTKEIDQALLDDKIDIAAHSTKDIESIITDGLDLFGVLEREDPRDALITTNSITSIENLPGNCLVGTSSPRRGAIIKSIREDIDVIEFRGNFETRIRKLIDKEVDATFLAMAGINRLSFRDCHILPIDTDTMIPAAGQGAIGLVAKIGDQRVIDIIQKLNHSESFTCIVAERLVLEKFGGSCFQPIAIYSHYTGINEISITAMISNTDGIKTFKIKEVASEETIFDIASDIGQKLLKYYQEELSKATI